MSRTRVMLIGALPVGSVNPRMPMYPAGGQGPSWRTNFITSATTVSQVPQNLMRVTDDGPPFRQSSVGSRAVPLEAHMLGKLGAFQEPSSEVVAMVVGLRVLGAGIGAYHGNKRNRGELGPTVGWGLAGFIAPFITVGVGLYQGLAKPKRR